MINLGILIYRIKNPNTKNEYINISNYIEIFETLNYVLLILNLCIFLLLVYNLI